jgi:ABC-type uncharacterized transport system substrate-binding protein/predicted MFS family arabinose efflux permease
MITKRANQIDSTVISLAMVGIVLALICFAVFAAQQFSLRLVPEFDAEAQAIGTSTAAVITRALDSGVPLTHLRGTAEVFGDVLHAHPELIGMRMDASDGSIRTLVGTIPAPQYRVAVPITLHGATVGSLVMGIDPQLIQRALSDLLFELAAIIAVAFFLGAEIFRIVNRKEFGWSLLEPTMVLEDASAGRFELGHPFLQDPRIDRLAAASASAEQIVREQIPRRASIGVAIVRARITALRTMRASARFMHDVVRANDGVRNIRAPLFLFMLAESITRPFLPVFASQLTRPEGLTSSLAASLPISSFMIVVALSQPFVLPWSRHFGRHRAMMLGAAMGTLAFAFAAFAPSLAVLVTLRLVGGLSYGIVFAAAQGYILDRTPLAERASALAIFVEAIMISEVCGPTIGGLIAERASASVGFLLSSLLCGIAVLLTLRAGTPKPVIAEQARFNLGELLTVFRSRHITALLLGSAMAQKIALYGLAYFTIPLVVVQLGQRPAIGGVLLMVYGIVMALGTIRAAAFAEKHQLRITFVIIGIVLSALAGFVPLVAPNVVGLAIMVVVLGLGQSLSIASQSALVGIFAHQAFPGRGDTAAYSAFRVIERFGNAIGPIFVGTVLARASFAIATAAIGAYLLVCACWLLFTIAQKSLRVRRAVTVCVAFFVVMGLLTPRASAASGGTRPFVIYMITYRGTTDVERGFKDELAREGIQATFIERNVHLDARKVAPLMDEIRVIHPDLVYTWGTPVTLAVTGTVAKPNPKLPADIPVLFTMVAAPVDVHLVPTLASSARNLTGVYHVAQIEDQYHAIAAYSPFTTVGTLYTASASNSVATINQLVALGKKQHFRVVAIPFAEPVKGKPTLEGIDQRIDAIKAAGAQWLYLPPDSFLGESLKVILAGAERDRLPTFGTTQQMTEAGVLAGVVAPYFGIGQLTAVLAKRILVEKTSPQNIPIATLERFSYSVSMGLAKRLDDYPPLALFRYIDISNR